jgi:hypothetical protein
MLLLFMGYEAAGKLVFTVSLLTMIASLNLSLIEMTVSIKALNLELTDLEKEDIDKLEKDHFI